MSTAVVTGSGGLIGAQAARRLHELGFEVVGIDNDMRRVFFGDEASTRPMSERLARELPRYAHHSIDIRDREAIESLFSSVRGSLEVVVHTAAQPSHDWAARDPFTDFGINANGTLNLLEATRRHCPEAVFIFTSTNKVYGDAPNSLPLEELPLRWEISTKHPYTAGIDENLTIDQSRHSLF